jgi:enamine deaminase RidA (YjgF/YER057c/UK114 family)
MNCDWYYLTGQEPQKDDKKNTVQRMAFNNAAEQVLKHSEYALELFLFAFKYMHKVNANTMYDVNTLSGIL